MRPQKDIAFVTAQGLLFIIYFLPVIQSRFQLGAILNFCSVFFTIIGFLIIVLAILQLSHNLTPFPSPKPKGTLIRTGLYKFIRHPIYSGILLLAFGYSGWCGNYWMLIVSIVLFVLFYLKSGYEESLLLKHFTDYKEYKENSYRFFPFLF